MHAIFFSCYIFLFKFKSFDQFNPPELPKILHIYSVEALQCDLFWTLSHAHNSFQITFSNATYSVFKVSLPNFYVNLDV